MSRGHHVIVQPELSQMMAVVRLEGTEPGRDIGYGHEGPTGLDTGELSLQAIRAGDGVGVMGVRRGNDEWPANRKRGEN
jgi:hypothetical protein